MNRLGEIYLYARFRNAVPSTLVEEFDRLEPQTLAAIERFKEARMVSTSARSADASACSTFQHGGSAALSARFGLCRPRSSACQLLPFRPHQQRMRNRFLRR